MTTPKSTDRQALAQRLSSSFENWVKAIDGPTPDVDASAYQAYCNVCESKHSLGRTAESIRAANALMQAFVQDGAPTDIPKMYGVLVGYNAENQHVVLKAYSGMIEHQRDLDGWVPAPDLPADLIAEERRAIAALDELRDRLFHVAESIASRRETLDRLRKKYVPEIEEFKHHIGQEREKRRIKRTALCVSNADHAAALDRLNQDSETLNRTLKRLKDEYRDARKPVEADHDEAMAQQAKLRRARRTISRNLQAKMHLAFRLTNFRGTPHRPIDDDSFVTAPPSGTGECAAPKLLNFAAQHGIRPTGLAEFWWNPESKPSGKVHGQFYGPCVERCQPIMSHLLCGLTEMMPFVPSASSPQGQLTILYEDDALVLVDKPAGLLSVPGRRLLTADNVITRLSAATASKVDFKTVHRLDMDTSGLLLVAKTSQAHQNLSKQFAARTVYKAYLAIVTAPPPAEAGLIDIPLGTTRVKRPMTVVDQDHGKPSLTRFTYTGRVPLGYLIRFEPLTGRTHQLRVHASATHGLNAPILGDPLYGDTPHRRMCLHAAELHFNHPIDGTRLTFQSDPDFE